jgi:hypothetical protein
VDSNEGKGDSMCSPAPIIVSQDIELLGAESLRNIERLAVPASLHERLRDWMHGLKQTFIAEVVSLGQPKERF